MALTQEDLTSIKEIVGGAEDQLSRRIDTSEVRFGERMDDSEERLLARINASTREAIDEISAVVREGHTMVGEEFAKVNARLDRGRQPWE